jgi:Fe-S oxidoreductase
MRRALTNQPGHSPSATPIATRQPRARLARTIATNMSRMQWEVWIFRLVVLAFVGWFGAQIATRVRILRAAPGGFVVDDVPARLSRFVREVVFQSKVIRARPLAGLAHLCVFWGFCVFAGFTGVEGLRGLGLVDVSQTRGFALYKLVLVPFSWAVIIGMSWLLVRRAIVRPPALGKTVSKESVLIAFFIIALMVTFLLTFRLHPGIGERVNWWAHMLIVLTFLGLIPNSKHLHLFVGPVAVFLRSPELGTVPNLDFDKEEVGLEAVKDLPAKAVLDAFSCVECGRCQDNCPAFGTGKALNPKRLILQNEDALLAGERDRKLVDVYDENVLWQCTTCGACEQACPVGVEHTPVIIGARRGLVSNGEAPDYLGTVYTNLERRQNIWGLMYDQRTKFVQSAEVEIFDPARHEYLVWLGCAGAFEADFQKSLRALFDLLRSRGRTFGVLSKERCTGDVAKRTGNEYMYQELAGQNIEDLKAAGVKKIVTSCPHCLKTIAHDYRLMGYEVEVVHSAQLIEALTRDVTAPAGERETVTYHDPCYLGRYANVHEEPRALLTRLGADVREPERARDNPFCCGAGGGLLFEEHESGKRISQERFEQLQAAGAGTVVMACPFCSIMLKGAQASANAPVEMVDLMTWVDGRLKKIEPRATPASADRPGPSV